MLQGKGLKPFGLMKVCRHAAFRHAVFRCGKVAFRTKLLFQLLQAAVFLVEGDTSGQFLVEKNVAKNFCCAKLPHRALALVIAVVEVEMEMATRAGTL